MRAALLTAPGASTVTQVDLGPLDAGSVRIELEGCGVCGSNLPVWQGRPWFEYPLPPGAPGHEGWGHVAALGDGIDERCRVGDRVAFLSDRAFADSVDVPATDLVVLPRELDGHPFPGEAIGCGVNVAARSGFRAGQTVAVVGIGFLGAVVTALAVDAGAEVIAVSRRPFSLDIARAMGAKEVVQMREEWEVVREVGDLTGGAGCDVVVEAVGAQEPLDIAAKLTKERGRLVIAGFHQDGRRTVDLQLWNWRGLDVVNAHERDPRVALDGIRRAADLIGGGRLDLAPLYTHSFPLERLGDGMNAMASRPDGFLKALIVR